MPGGSRSHLHLTPAKSCRDDFLGLLQCLTGHSFSTLMYMWAPEFSLNLQAHTAHPTPICREPELDPVICHPEGWLKDAIHNGLKRIQPAFLKTGL
jgi:hypothetical protein